MDTCAILKAFLINILTNKSFTSYLLHHPLFALTPFCVHHLHLTVRLFDGLVLGRFLFFSFFALL